MSIHCEFLSQGVIVYLSRVVSGNDLIELNQKIISHENSSHFQFQIIDLTEVVEFDVSAEDMQSLAKMDQLMEKDCKQYACVVAPTDFQFEMTRIWNTLAEGKLLESAVWRSREEAVSWLQSKGVAIESF